MSKKNQFPRSKVRARPDVKSMQATIPEQIVKQLHVRTGDSLEWIVSRSGDEDYVKVNVIREGANSRFDPPQLKSTPHP